jgi:ribonuclease P protein component
VRSVSMEVRTLTSPLPYPRVGIVVPRFGRTVVERNKVRRRLRELVRTRLLPRIPPQDVLLRAAPAAYARTFNALEREIQQLARALSPQVQ